MAQKRRSPGQTAISLSLEADLLKKIDQRAESLGLNRSTYLSLLARKDIAEKGDLIIRQKSPFKGGEIVPPRKPGPAGLTDEEKQ